MTLDRIPNVSQIINEQHYRDVAAGRVRPHELAYRWGEPQRVPTCRADAMEEGIQQGFFCTMAAFGVLPSPPFGTPENLLPYFVEGLLLGSEQAHIHLHEEQRAKDAAERQATNVISFRR